MEKTKARGIRFVLRNQLPSGEFPTLISNDRSFVGAQAQSNVFTTAIILHALRSVKEYPEVRAAARKAIRWLKDQRDLVSGFWVFWGGSMKNRPPEERIPPDIDSNASIVSVFRDWGVDFPYETFARALLEHRDKNGLFSTWICGTGLEWHPSIEPLVDRHDVDPVVNANAAYLFYQHGITLREIERYLERQIADRQFHQPSNYYFSPAIFMYALSKVLAYHQQLREGETGQACQGVLTSLVTETDSSKATPLEKAMALSAALKGALPLPRILVDSTLAGLKGSQAADGGWDPYPFHSVYFLHYGSRELTTALIVEAMALGEHEECLRPNPQP